MPEFNHPPYAATAITNPKQLNRWLDVNAQNGPLERNQAYFVLPVFTRPVTWLGYSDLAVTYNFVGPNNFSLKYLFQGAPNKGLLSPIPSNPNYSLAVTWIDKAGVVQRRFLWIATGAVFYFATQLYSNEKILKNFRLEVWTTNVANVLQTAPITLFTSVRGTQDYRYGTDFVLTNVNSTCILFSKACEGDLPNMVAVQGAGDLNVNGAYLQSGMADGKPFYVKMNTDNNNTIAWDGALQWWYVQDNDFGLAYTSNDAESNPVDVDPHTWSSRDPNALLPAPTFAWTNTFALPINFPANSVPAPN